MTCTPSESDLTGLLGEQHFGGGGGGGGGGDGGSPYQCSHLYPSMTSARTTRLQLGYQCVLTSHNVMGVCFNLLGTCMLP